MRSLNIYLQCNVFHFEAAVNIVITTHATCVVSGVRFFSVLQTYVSGTISELQTGTRMPLL